MKCDVVIPVGPGHEDLYRRAVESVRMATLAKGPFDTVGMCLIDDTKGVNGRSRARNEGVYKSHADILFFLDADDVIHPLAFETYGDHAHYDAVWGNIYELEQGTARWRYQVPEIRSLDQLLAFDPYLTLQMGHFVKSEIAKANPFNEGMDAGEDWDYYLRLWKKHHCIKVRESLFLNDRSMHSTGPRKMDGRQWREAVDPMLREAHNAAKFAA